MKYLIATILALLSATVPVYPADIAKKTPQPDLVSQQKLLEAALAKYDSQTKVESLMAFLANPYPEIKSTALKALSELPNNYKLNPAIWALPVSFPDLREYAASVLGDCGSSEAIPYLLKALFNDPDEKVRTNALNSLLKLTTRNKLVINMVDQLKTDGFGPYQIRAAGTLGEIGQGSDYAIGYMVNRLEIIRTWPAGPRAHVMFGDIFTYIKDYDLTQVNAQLSWTLPDPTPATVFGGVVLDVRVTKVEEFITIERDVIIQSLGRISGQSLGIDMTRWIAWWDGEKQKSPNQRYAEQKSEIEKSEFAGLRAPVRPDAIGTGGLTSEKVNIDLTGRLRLGLWCKYQGRQPEALQEFTAVLSQEPNNTLAHAILEEMGYVYYQNQCRPFLEVFPAREKQVYALLGSMRLPAQNQSIINKLAETNAIYKTRPFIKLLSAHPSENVRLGAVNGLGEIQDSRFMPYLIKPSLCDESEAVRNQALEVISKLGAKASIPWYIYILENNPDGTVLMRLVRILSEIDAGNRQIASSFLHQMYRLTAKLQPGGMLPNSPVPEIKTNNLKIGRTMSYGSVQIELPELSLTTFQKLTAHSDVDPAAPEAQLKVLGDGLARLTAQEFGTDYSRWIEWWQAYSRQNNPVSPQK